LSKAIVATGSVADISAPNRSHAVVSKPEKPHHRRPRDTSTQLISVPATAKRLTAIRFRRKIAWSMENPHSKMIGGNSTKKKKSQSNWMK